MLGHTRVVDYTEHTCLNCGWAGYVAQWYAAQTGRCPQCLAGAPLFRPTVTGKAQAKSDPHPSDPNEEYGVHPGTAP